MSGPPNNVLQFSHPQMTEEEYRKTQAYYRGSCGPDQDFWPKRHRWGPWEYSKSGRYRERMCKTCSLVSDPEWLDEDQP